MSSTGLETCVRLLSSMLANDTREIRARTVAGQKMPRAKTTPAKIVHPKSGRTPKVASKKTGQRAVPVKRSKCQEGEPCQRQIKKNPPINLVSESENSTNTSIPMPLNSTDAVKMAEAVSSYMQDLGQPILKMGEPDVVAAPSNLPPGVTLYNQRLPSSTPNITPIDFKDGDSDLSESDQRILQLAQIIHESRMKEENFNAPKNAQSGLTQKIPLQIERDVDATSKPRNTTVVKDHAAPSRGENSQNLVSDLTANQMAQYWNLLMQHNPEKLQNLSAEMNKINPTPSKDKGYPPEGSYPPAEGQYSSTDGLYSSQKDSLLNGNVYPPQNGSYPTQSHGYHPKGVYPTQNAVYPPNDSGYHTTLFPSSNGVRTSVGSIHQNAAQNHQSHQMSSFVNGNQNAMSYNQPTNKPTVNGANQPMRPSGYQPALNQPALNQPALSQSALNQPALNQPVANQPTSHPIIDQAIRSTATVTGQPIGSPLYQPTVSSAFGYHGNHSAAPFSASLPLPFDAPPKHSQNDPRSLSQSQNVPKSSAHSQNVPKGSDHIQDVPRGSVQVQNVPKSSDHYSNSVIDFSTNSNNSETPKKNPTLSDTRDSSKKVHFGIQTEEKLSVANQANQYVDEIPSRDTDGQRSTAQNHIPNNSPTTSMKCDDEKLRLSQDSLGSSGHQTKAIYSQCQQTDPEHNIPPGEPPLSKPYNLVAVWRLVDELKRTTIDHEESATLVGRLETTVGQLDTQWTTDVNLALQPLRSQNADLRRRLRIAQQQLKQEMEKLAEASKPELTPDLLHLGLQRRHLETKLATEHVETERLRGEMALLQGQVENLLREKKDLYNLISHKENEYLKNQQERIEEAKNLRVQLEEVQEEKKKMKEELEMTRRNNKENLKKQGRDMQQQGAVHQLLRGLEGGLRDMLRSLEDSESTPEQRAALERMLMDTSYLGSQTSFGQGSQVKTGYIPASYDQTSVNPTPKQASTDKTIPTYSSESRHHNQHPIRTSGQHSVTTRTLPKTDNIQSEVVRKTAVSPTTSEVTQITLTSTDDPDNLLDDQDSTLVEETFPANMTVQSFLSLTEYFRRYPKSNFTSSVLSQGSHPTDQGSHPTSLGHQGNQPTSLGHQSNQPTSLGYQSNQPTSLGHQSNQPTSLGHRSNQPTPKLQDDLFNVKDARLNSQKSQNSQTSTPELYHSVESLKSKDFDSSLLTTKYDDYVEYNKTGPKSPPGQGKKSPVTLETISRTHNFVPVGQMIDHVANSQHFNPIVSPMVRNIGYDSGRNIERTPHNPDGPSYDRPDVDHKSVAGAAPYQSVSQTTSESPPQGQVYKGTQLDTSLSTIKDAESVSSAITWSSMSSFNDEMFQEGLQKLDDHIAQLQASLKKSG